MPKKKSGSRRIAEPVPPVAQQVAALFSRHAEASKVATELRPYIWAALRDDMCDLATMKMALAICAATVHDEYTEQGAADAGAQYVTAESDW